MFPIKQAVLIIFTLVMDNSQYSNLTDYQRALHSLSVQSDTSYNFFNIKMIQSSYDGQQAFIKIQYYKSMFFQSDSSVSKFLSNIGLPSGSVLLDTRNKNWGIISQTAIVDSQMIGGKKISVIKGFKYEIKPFGVR